MAVKNEIFFHIHRNNEYSNKWTVGSRIDFVNRERNAFNRFYDNFGFVTNIFNIGKNEYIIESITSYNALTQQDRTLLIDKYLSIFINTVKEQSKYIRETIFEEVRMTYFPHLPSRRTCIWLCEQDSVEYWWKNLGNDIKILKLSVTGIIHRADQIHLNADTYSHNILRTNAIKYWTGADGCNKIEEELLFEGIVDIIDEYKNVEEYKSRI